MPTPRKLNDVEKIVDRIRKKMEPWGITVSFLAQQLGVSRQYAWQIVHYRTFLSEQRATEIESAVDGIIEQRKHITTFGERLRAARISAGLTLKQVATMIGYSWVGVERWEKDVCLPKPGVLWHLASLYGAEWMAPPGLPAEAHVNGRSVTVLPQPRHGVREELAQTLRTSLGLYGHAAVRHQSTFTPEPAERKSA